MAGKQEIAVDSLQMDIERLSGEEKIALIDEMSGTLSLPELLRARDMLAGNYTHRMAEERGALIAEMESRMKALGMSIEEAVTKRPRKRTRKTPAAPKYMSPDGKTWSGRGVAPQWVREIEKNGHTREEYRIPVENGE